MDAIQLIKDNLDVESILKHYEFDNITASGNYIRSCCKIHDGGNSTAFVINYDEGLWSCHTGDCGNGDIFTLVQKLEGITFPFAVHKVAEILGLDLGDLEIVARTRKEKKEIDEFLKIIKKHNKTEQELYIIRESDNKVKKYKEFKQETMEYFDLRYYEEYNCETFKMKNVLGFPIEQKGKTVGISLRATLPGKLKWVHQPSNIKTGELLYNYDNAVGSDTIVVVEGITDVWAYHEIGIKAVATYGAHIKEEQIRMLLRTGADLVFSFDGDKAGREAMEQAKKIFGKTSNIWFVDIPDGKDPESISRKKLEELYVYKRR